MDIKNVKQLALELNMNASNVRSNMSEGKLPYLQAGRGFISTSKGIDYYKFIQEHHITLNSLERSAKVISFVNHKGGCSKTTSAYTIAALLQRQKNKVLLVDLDPQGNSTQTVLEPFKNAEGIIIPFPKTIKDLLLEQKVNGNISSSQIKDIIKKSKFDFDCIPCDLSLNSIINELESSSFKEIILKEVLNQISYEYDYIIIDTPPTLGFSVISSLTASDYICIVSLAEAFSLLGVEQTINLIKDIKKQTEILANPKALDILGIIVSKVEMNTNVSRHFVYELQSFADEMNINVYSDNLIPKTIKIPETQATGELINDIDVKGDASIAYFNIAMDIDMKVKKDRILEKLSK
jgi:chromosome partitioning protein